MTGARSALFTLFDGFGGDDTAAYHHIEGDLSYRVLHDRAGALATHLALLARASALGADHSPILIWGHKHHSYLVAYWACLLLGRALIPVEPDTPADRLRQIIATSGAGLALCTEARLPPEVAAFLGDRVQNIRDFVSTGSRPGVDTANDADTAYIMYSSGSSGAPKGIKVTYANLVHFVDWVRCDLLTDVDFNAITGNVRHCFDVSLFELWAAWSRKRPISALDHSEFINSRKYIERYRDHGVGVWVSTPSTVQFYLKDPRFKASNLPQLSCFVFCGEVLAKPLVRLLRDRFPLARIINTYGPTECTVAVTAVEVSQAHMADDKPLPIGFARPGCALSLQNGQIVIAGAAVGPGYIGLPEKQVAAFPVQGQYRTGDIGAQTAEGLWYFHGRMDREIKLSGVRIDLNEIEEEIRNLPAVNTAFIEPFFIGDSLRGLQAYVSGPASVDALPVIAAQIARILPPVMVPRFWHLCADICFNQNTKIDKAQTIARAHAKAASYAYSDA